MTVPHAVEAGNETTANTSHVEVPAVPGPHGNLSDTRRQAPSCKTRPAA